MSRKLLISSMFAATSLWVTGCQHRSSADNRLTREPTVCNAAPATAPQGAPAPLAGPALPALPPDKGNWTRGHAEIADVPPNESIIVLPEQPAPRRPQPPRPMPVLEPSPMLPVEPPPPSLPASRPDPKATAPREAPLPAPVFPDVLPAPANTNVQRSSHQTESGSDSEIGTLTGEVQQYRRGWRLRYAAVDAEDAHGGSVVLSGPGLTELRDGARIRVSGRLVPAADRHNSAQFHVQSVYVLEP